MSEYKKEIERAILARSDGNEGMARVCARRAAGIIIGEYLTRLGFTDVSRSAFDRLSKFISLPDLDQKYLDVANHFLIRVNHEHNLPLKLDLIKEAIWLEKNLIGDDSRIYASTRNNQ